MSTINRQSVNRRVTISLRRARRAVYTGIFASGDAFRAHRRSLTMFNFCGVRRVRPSWPRQPITADQSHYVNQSQPTRVTTSPGVLSAAEGILAVCVCVCV